MEKFTAGLLPAGPLERMWRTIRRVFVESPSPLRLSAIASAATLSISTLVLFVGWGLDVETLRRLDPHLAAMAPSTAICFAMISVALLARIASEGRSRVVPRLAIAIASLVTVTAVADLCVILSGAARGIDGFLMSSIESYHSASMAPATALYFLLAAFCLVVSSRALPLSEGSLVTAATVGLLGALVALVGYAFDTSALYSLSMFAAMALHTALCFAGLFLAVLLMNAERGWVGILTHPGAGSVGARRLFPIVVAVPLLLCLLALLASSRFLATNFVLAVLAIAIIVLLAGAVLRNAVVENRAERRLIELGEELRAAVTDRDLLLSEVHHRVKNNLQQIISLLQIEACRLDDPSAREAFRITAGRVRSMGVVHRMLISSGNFASVGTSRFLRSLCDNIVPKGEGATPSLTVDVEAIDLPMPIDTAVAVGLLVTECVTNAVKHAFPDRREGTIRIRFRRLDGDAELCIADDGIGMPGASYETSPSTEDGTGTLLINGLVAQLDADMTLEVDGGTRLLIRIPARSLEASAHA